ncbi:MAG: hypothetical protein NZ750_01280 [Anaerolineae bacterium]|nr:hypothetical protein [Anaerolineae bacterium]MDW8173217.1 hypothetical protein [Anaerolineae bacterium]
MKNIWLAAVSLLLALLTGCTSTPPILSIGLLGPFEGRHRRQGYEALYAVRLALADSGTEYHLLALDDGGTLESAEQRAAALALDQSVVHVLLVGELANDPLVKVQLKQPFTSVQPSTLPDEAFRQRYLASARYAPTPNALALASYRAALSVTTSARR